MILSLSPDRLFVTLSYWNHSKTAIKADHFALTKDEALRVASDIEDRYETAKSAPAPVLSPSDLANSDAGLYAPTPREDDAIRKALECGRELSELANGIHCDATEQFGTAIRQLAAERERTEKAEGEVLALIEELGKFTTIARKTNLARPSKKPRRRKKSVPGGAL